MTTETDQEAYPSTQNLIPQIYLSQFEDVPGELTLQSGEPIEIKWRGEILLDVQEIDEGRWEIRSVRRIALNSLSVEPLEGEISIAGPRDELAFVLSSGEQILDFGMRGYYPFLNRLGSACEESDAIYPLLEKFQGEVILAVSGEVGKESGLEVQVLLKQESNDENSFETPLQTLSFGPAILTFTPLPPQFPSENPHHSLVTCSMPPPGGTGHTHKKLNIRFVSLLSPQPLPSDLENWVQELLDGACKVWWSKGGIKIDPKPTIDLGSFLGGVIPQLQETAVPTNVGQDANRIDVYLVEQLTARPGGGVTHACGTNGAYVLLEMGKARNNKYLLAHELGHVLGLHHPGRSADCSEFREGSFCSIMVPDKPNSSRNTVNNLAVIETPSYPLTPPVFQTLSSGGWATDIVRGYFHIIRDYPYDTGDPEPPIPESPIVNWWSYSDVWNSPKPPKAGQNQDRLYSDNTNMFQPNHSPVHDNPQYSGPLSLPNRMYVQLHGCENLVSPVNVYLYLAVPGLSSQPLSPLNAIAGPHIVFSSADLPSTLPTPGTPKNKKVDWAVPAGFPSHSCVFAVAKSANEPIPAALNTIVNTPTIFNFYDLAALRNPINDVAQRNLDIQNAPKFASQSLKTLLPWVEMSHDPAGLEGAWLEIDTSRAPEHELESLILEINGQEIDEIIIGEPWRKSVSEVLQNEKRLIIRLRAILPPGIPEGTTFPIDLQFFVNNDNEPVTGYRHIIRLGLLSETVFQVLDRLAGTLRDVNVGCQILLSQEIAEKLVEFLVREMVIEPPESRYKYWQTELKSYSNQFSELANQLQSSPESDETCKLIAETMNQLNMFISEDWDGTPPELIIEQIREFTDYLQEPACQSVRLRMA